MPRTPEPIEVEISPHDPIVHLPDDLLRRLAREIAQDLADGRRLDPEAIAKRVFPGPGAPRP